VTHPVEVVDDTVVGPHGEVPIRRYRPAGSAVAAPTLLWLHGGGFFAGDLDLPESHAVALALARRGVPVVTADYRLGPLPGMPWVGRRGPRGRRRWPVPHDDVVAVQRVLRAESSAGLLLGGASAGACLAAGVAAGLVAGGAEALDGLVLAYGFFHARLPRDRAVQRRVRGHRRVTHAPWGLDRANRVHGGEALGEARAFPGGHDLAGFPPTLMVDADRDAMRASGDRFALELGAAGVALERHVLTESRHAFLNRPGTEDFRQAVDLVVGFGWGELRGPRDLS
jgi:acetyl esterase